MLDFGEAVRRFYRNYANAEGRAQRSAYWWVQFYQIIIYAVLIIVVFMADGGDQILGIFGEALNGNADPELTQDFNLGRSGIFALLLMVCFLLANILPNIMLSIRRFHDLNQTGWLVLLFFVVGQIPILGTLSGLANLIWFIMPGTDGSNKYGPDPLATNTDVFG
jgi:uncharacterized membrane protein YhaH (DUF805 family)